MIHRLLDRLAERYSEREHKLEAMRAREEYFDRAGKVFDDDAELFEGRMAAFLEWYVLERPLAGIGLTPVACAIEAGETLDIEDLIGGGRFAVRERRKPLGMAAGDVFEARLVWEGDTLIFGRTFLFHPPDAREVVLEWAERAVSGGVAREEILFHLSRQHIRWQRHGHSGAAKGYRDA